MIIENLVIGSVLGGLLGFIMGRINRILKTMSGIKEEISDMEDDVFRINKNLSIDSFCPRRYYITVYDGTCADVNVVYGPHGGDREYHFTVKRFVFGDDKDFALREAEELLTHLNDK